MACLVNQPNGRKSIQFKDAEGKRRTIYLGKMQKRQADVVKLKVERLVSAKFASHSPDDSTLQWISELGDSMRKKMAKAGLIEDDVSTLLGPFLEHYIESRKTDLKPRTIVLLKQASGSMLEYFGAEKKLRDITPGDADAYRLFLLQKLALNTANRRIGRARQFMRQAIRQKLIQDNPFEGISATVKANPDKFRFITLEETTQLIEACPDCQWRAIIALCRYGGLRCPSEVLQMRWEHINWEQQRIYVRSPKTEHHEGKEARVIPLFPELKTILEECWEQASPGATYIISRYRSQNSNLRTQFIRIIKRAGIVPWPKPFVNLRASCSTEMFSRYPEHVATAWMGHTKSIAQKHYLQVTEAHFQKALQNALQYSAEMGGNGQKSENTAHEKTPVLQGVSFHDEELPTSQVPKRGLEPPRG